MTMRANKRARDTDNDATMRDHEGVEGGLHEVFALRIQRASGLILTVHRNSRSIS